MATVRVDRWSRCGSTAGHAAGQPLVTCGSTAGHGAGRPLSPGGPAAGHGAEL